MRCVLIFVTALVAVSQALSPFSALLSSPGYGFSGIGLAGARQNIAQSAPLENMKLTCSASFSPPNSPQVTEAMAINIKGRQASQSNKALGASAVISPFGGAFGSLLGGSLGATGLGGYGVGSLGVGAAGLGGYGVGALGVGTAGLGAFRTAPGGDTQGLSATMEIFSRTGGDVTIMVTERGFMGEGCVPDNFGGGLSPQAAQTALNANSQNLGLGTGYGALSTAAGLGVASLGAGLGVPGLGTGFFTPALGVGFANPNALNARQKEPSGVLTTATLQPGVAKVISVDRMAGFENMASLAGRGVVACNGATTGYDSSSGCTGEILSCCVLAYDNHARSLNLNSYGR